MVVMVAELQSRQGKLYLFSTANIRLVVMVEMIVRPMLDIDAEMPLGPRTRRWALGHYTQAGSIIYRFSLVLQTLDNS